MSDFISTPSFLHPSTVAPTTDRRINTDRHLTNDYDYNTTGIHDGREPGGGLAAVVVKNNEDV